MTDEPGYLWAIGGKIEDEHTVDDTTVYDVAADEWHSSVDGDLAPMPHGVQGAGWARHDGLIYCFGGKTGAHTDPVAHVQVYDIADDEWTLRDPMPEPRSKLGKHYPIVDGRYVYLFGGDTAEGRFSRVGWNWRYDVEKDAWDRGVADAPYSQSFPLPSARGEWLYYATGNTQRRGGQNDYPGALNQRYHPATDRWQVVAPCPHPVTDGSGTRLGDELHFLGGWNTNREFYHEDAAHYRGPVKRHHAVYGYAANAWRYEDPLPGHWHHGGTRAADGALWHYLGSIDEEEGTGADQHTDRIFRWDGDGWSERSRAPVKKMNFGTVHTVVGPGGDRSGRS